MLNFQQRNVLVGNEPFVFSFPSGALINYSLNIPQTAHEAAFSALNKVSLNSRHKKFKGT